MNTNPIATQVFAKTVRGNWSIYDKLSSRHLAKIASVSIPISASSSSPWYSRKNSALLVSARWGARPYCEQNSRFIARLLRWSHCEACTWPPLSCVVYRTLCTTVVSGRDVYPMCSFSALPALKHAIYNCPWKTKSLTMNTTLEVCWWIASKCKAEGGYHNIVIWNNSLLRITGILGMNTPSPFHSQLI